MLNIDKCHLGKFIAKADKEVYLGYFLEGKPYRVFNKRTLVIEESTNVIFDELDKITKTRIYENNKELITHGVENVDLENIEEA